MTVNDDELDSHMAESDRHVDKGMVIVTVTQADVTTTVSTGTNLLRQEWEGEDLCTLHNKLQRTSVLAGAVHGSHSGTELTAGALLHSIVEQAGQVVLMVALEHVCIQAVEDTHGLCVGGNQGGRSDKIGRGTRRMVEIWTRREGTMKKGREGRGGERMI